MGRRRPATPEQRAAARERDNALHTAVDQAMNDPEWLTAHAEAFARFGATVRNKSPRNQAMLLIQAEERGIELRDVRTFRQWLEAGRCVMEGQKALRMCAPKGTEPADGWSWADAPAAEEAGDEPVKTRFRLVSVFDISQTTDDPAKLGGFRTDEHVMDQMEAGKQRSAEQPPPEGTVRLDLGEHYGPATVRIEVHAEKGRTRYTVVRARNISGSVTVTPELDHHSDTTTPLYLRVDYGDTLSGERYRSYEPYEDALIVNGITLISGAGSISIEDGLSGRGTLWARRPTGWATSQHVPVLTDKRVTAFVGAVVDHWLSQPGKADLMAAAARTAAPERQADRARAAERLDDEIAALVAKRDAAAAAAAGFAALTSGQAGVE